MTKNPFANAGLAMLYIILVASFMRLGSTLLADKPDTIFAPIGMISLLVLSAAIMGYLFFYQPVAMIAGGRQAEGVTFFFKTLSAFALFTLVAITLLLTLS